MNLHQSYSEALGGPALQRAAMALVLLLAAALLAPRAMAQSIFLNPSNPLANFVKDGNQGATPGLGTMVLVDASGTDHIGFLGATSAAAEGNVLDLVATFRLQSNDQPNGVDSGMRLIINDGSVTSFVAGCVTLGGISGVAIAIGNNFSDGQNWAGFVPVDWLSETTLTIRRYANLDAEIIAVNGVGTPLGSTLVGAASLPGSMTGFASVGFGLFADVAFTTVEINSFSAVAVTAVPEPETYAMLLSGLGMLGFAARRRKLKLAA